MTDTDVAASSHTLAVRRSSLLRGLARYTFSRAAILLVTVITAVYLTILIANYGGFVDEIIRNRIAEQIAGMVMGGWLKDVPTEEKFAIIEQTTQAMEAAAGLNDPFLLRTLRWLSDGLTLNWGEVRSPGAFGGSRTTRDVRLIIAENLSRTLFVFGSANVLLFFTTVFLSLVVVRRYGSKLDRLFVFLSPLSSAPAWVYGVILNIVLIRVFTFSVGGTFDVWPDEFRFAYLPLVLKHLIPPLLAIFLSGLFQGVYTWRTFFLIYSSEEHVDMAKAKGLKPRLIERRYILRPALPAIITSFALLAMGLWQEIIALEYFFEVAGIGRLFLAALRSLNTPMVVGLVVTFAYLMAITVFLLDIIYALVDPRVRVVGSGNSVRVTSRKRRPWLSFRKRNRQAPAARTLAVAPLPSDVREQSSSLTTADRPQLLTGLWRGLQRAGPLLQQVSRYPSAVLGLTIIAALVAMSVYTLIALPYGDAIPLWRGDSAAWSRNPKYALPTWVNLFRLNDLPPNMTIDSHDQGASKSVTVLTDEITEIIITLPIEFSYGGFPEDLTLTFDAQFREKQPHITLEWVTPTGREYDIASFATRASQVYRFSQDERLQRRLETPFPQRVLFVDPSSPEPVPLQGTYVLRISALVFEEESDIDARLDISGQVFGLAGTDERGRDLMIALLWGAPVALSFGLIAAVATSVSGMLFAAIGSWLGGWVDRSVQFLTEVNLILPFFPVSLMIYTLYSKSLWTVLGVTVLLSIFGSSVKTYRATFLQVKESPYIEAAQAYGASDRRIVMRYLIPRIVTILVPRLVILVPSYVFLEATLAFLGLSDPVLPTWGKLVVAALSSGIHRNAYHMVLAPLGLLMLTGFAFAMVGLTLERVFEPRLRET